jgi:hypothetical protein
MKVNIMVFTVMTTCSLVVMFRRNILPPSSGSTYSVGLEAVVAPNEC